MTTGKQLFKTASDFESWVEAKMSEAAWRDDVRVEMLCDDKRPALYPCVVAWEFRCGYGEIVLSYEFVYMADFE